MHPSLPRLAGVAFGLGVLLPPTVAQGPTWADPAARPSPRSSHAVAFDSARGRLVLFSGDSGGETWERAGDVWILRTPAHRPAARDNGALAYDPTRGVTVLYGGTTPTGSVLRDTWEWDGDDWTRVLPPQSPPPLERSGMTWHGGANPGILLHGGFTTGGVASRATWQFDGATWTLRAGNGPDYLGATMAYASSTQRTYTYYAPSWFVWELWAWDGTAWSLVATFGNVPFPGNYEAGMAYDPERDALILVGGADSSRCWAITPSSPPRFSMGPALTAEAATKVIWRKLAYDSSRRAMVAFGGIGSFLPSGNQPLQRPVNDLIELPSSATANWVVRRSLTATPSGRVYTDMTFDAARGQMVLFGGVDSAALRNDTWTFDGASWTDHGPGLPAPRAQAALAYEASLGTVLFGGGTMTGRYYGDTLFWNGTGWALGASGRSGPPARMGHDMVADTARGRILMFGGYNGTALADTWQLQRSGFGSQWTRLSTVGSPGPRQSHAMAFDARRRTVVLFGGVDAVGLFFGDTWELTESNAGGPRWNRRNPSQSPPARRTHAMAWDAARGVVVLTGGYGDPQCGNYCARHLDDVWEFDGVTWHQRTPSTSLPPAREGAGFAFDPVRQRCVLQGGSGGGVITTGTWYYDAALDRVAMVGAAETLRCTRFPAAGSEVTFSFPTDYGYGWLLFAASTSSGVGMPAWYGSLCNTGALIGYPDTLYGAMGQPSSASFVVPAAMAGLSFTAQGMWLESTACFGLTDALVVTVRAP